MHSSLVNNYYTINYGDVSSVCCSPVVAIPGNQQTLTTAPPRN